MKKTILLFASAIALFSISCNQNSQTETTNTDSTEIIENIALSQTEFVVSGNCGMCKERIELAVTELEGVEIAEWDSDTQMITVNYNADLVSIDAMHQAIAAKGHDTEKVKANEETYNSLPDCCQYKTVEKH